MLKNKILITIIVPVYNVEKYVSHCIESILRQTYDNLQILLVDDGSTDKSGLICDEYAEKDKRITVIHKTNRGLSDARNVGLDNAKGDYICFIDADDYVRETYVDDLLISALKHKADISVCLFEMGINDTFQNLYNNQFNETILSNLEALNKLYDNELSVNMIVSWNKLYSKELFNKIRFPISRIHEDEFITHQLLYNANRIVIINKYDYYYFQSPNSIIRSNFKLNRLDALTAFEERIKFFENKGLNGLKNKTYVKYSYLIIQFICILDELCNREFEDKKILLIKKLRKITQLILNLNEANFKLKIQVLIFYLCPKIGISVRKLYLKLLKIRC